MTEPIQKPGRSKQDYGTPWAFIHAVTVRLGIDAFTVDLAADRHNSKGLTYISKEQDSLAMAWESLSGPAEFNWLNPEFSNIAPWAAKCARFRTRGGQVALLVPAGIGSNWFRDHVHGHALVLALNGRITFDGCTDPYPKDCILALYSPHIDPGFEVWTWKQGKAVDAVARAVDDGTAIQRATKRLSSEAI